MSAYLSIMKYFFYTFNVICMVLSIGAICINFLGLQNAKTGTDEHAYFLVGIILVGLICLTTFFGFYAAFNELIGVNIVYSLLLIILLAVQFLQKKNFCPQNFYQYAIQQVENAWQQLEARPQLMAAIEEDYNCCALDHPSDYKDQHLIIPPNCYNLPLSEHSVDPHFVLGCRRTIENSYDLFWKREGLYNWWLMAAEIIGIVSAVSWASTVYMLRRYERMPRLSRFMQRLASHSSSRSLIITH